MPMVLYESAEALGPVKITLEKGSPQNRATKDIVGIYNSKLKGATNMPPQPSAAVGPRSTKPPRPEFKV